MRASVAASTQLSRISSRAATAAISSHVAARSSSTRPTRITWLATSIPNVAQHQLGKGAGGHASCRLAGRRALQHVTGVRKVVLQGPGQIGVPWPRRSHRLVLGWIPRLHRKLLLPVLPVAIHDLDRDRRANRLPVAHAAENVRLVGLDLHAAAAAVALLAPPQFAVHEIEIDRHAGGQSGDQRNQCFPMRLPGC